MVPINSTNIPIIIWNFLSGLPLIPTSKNVAESWLSRGELGLVVFGAAIIIGLIGEYWADHSAERRERAWIPPHSRKHWNWKLIFAGVVVLTIIGEFISDADIWITSDVLQAISDGEIEKLRSDNLAVEAQIRPRQFVQEKFAQLVTDLKELSEPGTRVDIIAFTSGSSPDTFMVANALVNAFMTAHWSPKFWTALTAANGFDGVQVAHADEHPPNPPSELAARVAEAITKAGVPAVRSSRGASTELPAPLAGVPWDISDVAKIRVMVASKPMK